MNVTSPCTRYLTQALLALALCSALANPALAAGGGALPWDAPLQTLVNDLTGPVATAISTGALFAAGGFLVFGGELGIMVALLLKVVAAIALLVLGANFLAALGLVGAVI
jgi:type IV secretory pathway VirB2 component (pilin)